MSHSPTISLRGIIRRQEGGGWEWTGIWVFGALPHNERDSVTDEGPTLQTIPSKKKKGKRKFVNHVKGSRPFRYHFCEARDASTVKVPWLNDAISDLPENDTEKAEKPASPLIPIGRNDTPTSPKSSPIPKAEIQASEPIKMDRMLLDDAAEPNGKSGVEKIVVHAGKGQRNGSKDTLAHLLSDPSPRSSLEILDKQLLIGDVRTSAIAITTASRPVTSDVSHGTAPAIEEEESTSVITNSSCSFARPLPPTATADDNKPESAEFLNGTSSHLENASLCNVQTKGPQRPLTSSSIDLTTHADETALSNSTRQELPLSSNAPEASNLHQHDCLNNSQEKLDPSLKESVTFASLTPYIDASIKFPDVCPCGGSWKGYFENVQIRKDRKSSRVSETFFLFFNAAPHPTAKSFYDLKGNSQNGSMDGVDITLSILKPEQIHVRGMGSNQFGDFEIVGSFDMSSSILHCHRIYIFSTKQDSQIQDQSITSTQSMDKPAPAATVEEGQGKKAYFTRKKQMKWHRYDASGDESDSEKEKRARRRKNIFMGIPSNSSFSSSGPLTGSITNVAKLPKKADPSNASRKRPPPSSLSHEVPRISPHMETAPSSISLKKKMQDQGILASDVMVLPTVPDEQSFRWKAAHIFSTTRISDDPAGLSSFSASGTDTATARRFITVQSLYEGECKGRFREWLGICLYENGNIYEGWWHRNKEHGKGILMTGDRHFVIYEGDWERGRMNGKGIYYYSYNSDFSAQLPPVNDNISIDNILGPLRIQRGGGIYRGDFKENCRHGLGAYTLPDGSVYDGEWRDNVQNGRGIFRWVDGSYYDGQWKDGKRHGIGTYKASDGFFYEGQWATNAMEGRGCCIYPNGQRYEGAFSKGKKEGRGTLQFPNGAVYEGRFKDDCIEGQGTMKMLSNVTTSKEVLGDETEDDGRLDWMIPLQFQSDMSHIHQKAGFTKEGS